MVQGKLAGIDYWQQSSHLGISWCDWIRHVYVSSLPGIDESAQEFPERHDKKKLSW